MVLRNCRRRFQQAVVQSLGLGVGDLGCGGFQSDIAFRVAVMILDLGVFGTGSSPGKARRGGGSELDSGTCGCFEKALGSLDTCYHCGRGQILTITDALCFLTCWSMQKVSRGSEVGWKESLML